VNDFGKMNEVYGTYFKDAPPARATVGVARLPRDMKIEIFRDCCGSVAPPKGYRVASSN
jgi:hypothetical protein